MKLRTLPPSFLMVSEPPPQIVAAGSALMVSEPPPQIVAAGSALLVTTACGLSVGGVEHCSPDLGRIDADFVEQSVRQCVFDFHHPDQQSGRVDRLPLASVGILTGALEGLLDS